MANDVTVRHLWPGALWTFVHSSGKETEYIYDRQMIGACADPTGKGPGLDAMHALTNPATGGEAQVSEKWLREGPIGSHSHWLPKAEAPKEVAAA